VYDAADAAWDKDRLKEEDGGLAFDEDF